MNKSKKGENFIDKLDAQFVVSSDAIEGAGEDGFCCSCAENAALIGVFDGCGGLGARQYKRYQGHTGAYMASRLASGAVYDWFQVRKRENDFSDPLVDVKERITGALSFGEKRGGETLKLRGSMVRDFPSTAAIVLAEQKEGKIIIDAMWAGDSRVYLLDQVGLGQLSKDDTDSVDAFKDLRDDPVQTNVLSSDGNYVLHSKRVHIKGPIAVIAASDGYFGYWKTPMDFEYYLLDTLERSNSLSEWKEKLRTEIQEVTGDDSTLAAMLFYFGNFKEVKKTYRDRYEFLKKRYVLPLTDSYTEDKAIDLWQDYRHSYERFMN